MPSFYPGQLIEEYRKTVRGLYIAYYSEEGLKNATCGGNGRFRGELHPAAWAPISALYPAEGTAQRD